MKSQKAWTKKWLRLRQHHETQIQCSTAVSNSCIGGFSVPESWTKCKFHQRSWYLHSSYQQSVSLHHPADDTSREKGYEAARPPTASDLPLSGKSELGGADERFLKWKKKQTGSSKIWTQVKRQEKQVCIVYSVWQSDRQLVRQSKGSQPVKHSFCQTASQSVRG